MTKDTISELLSRRQLLDEYGLADSTERRGRLERQGWPPHLLINKKIYYRRRSVEKWFDEQEQGCTKARMADLPAQFPNLDDRTSPPAQKTVDPAAVMSGEQRDSVRSVKAGSGDRR